MSPTKATFNLIAMVDEILALVRKGVRIEKGAAVPLHLHFLEHPIHNNDRTLHDVLVCVYIVRFKNIVIGFTSIKNYQGLSRSSPPD